jgi:hypothetical protein
MKLIFPSKKLNGVTLYAHTKSSDKMKEYLVVKAKTGDGGVNYRCTCEGFMFRGQECRHIKELKKKFASITYRG